MRAWLVFYVNTKKQIFNVTVIEIYVNYVYIQIYFHISNNKILKQVETNSFRND